MLQRRWSGAAWIALGLVALAGWVCSSSVALAQTPFGGTASPGTADWSNTPYLRNAPSGGYNLWPRGTPTPYGGTARPGTAEYNYAVPSGFAPSYSGYNLYPRGTPTPYGGTASPGTAEYNYATPSPWGGNVTRSYPSYSSNPGYSTYSAAPQVSYPSNISYGYPGVSQPAVTGSISGFQGSYPAPQVSYPSSVSYAFPGGSSPAVTQSSPSFGSLSLSPASFATERGSSPSVTVAEPAWPKADSTALIEITVPPDAKVWFDNETTNHTGSVRYFVTPALSSSKPSQYEVHARWTENGQPVDRREKLAVEPGKRAFLSFSNAPAGR